MITGECSQALPCVFTEGFVIDDGGLWRLVALLSSLCLSVSPWRCLFMAVFVCGWVLVFTAMSVLWYRLAD